MDYKCIINTVKERERAGYARLPTPTKTWTGSLLARELWNGKGTSGSPIYARQERADCGAAGPTWVEL